MMILRKAGPLQTSAENSGGTMWHAVEEGMAVEGGPLCVASARVSRGQATQAMQSLAQGVEPP